jgi:murein DD-endopeptidase MepM/ murein hydrolase activator NlpD
MFGLPSAGAQRGFAQAPVTLNISPRTALQGDVFIVRANVPDGVALSGALDGQPLGFVKDRAGRGPGFIGLAGVDPLRKPGRYPVLITATLNAGGVITAEAIVTVRDAGFKTEAVTLPVSLTNTIDPAVSAAEESQVKAVYAGFTEIQLWRGPFREPLKGKVLSRYGNRRTYNGIDLGTFHAGIDFYGLKGRPVLAAAAGRVVFVKQLTVRGNTIIVDHGRGVFTAYAHLSKTLVKPGQQLAVGDKIGEVGSTGRSQGNHLHFEVAIGGVAVEPSFWLEKAIP